MTAIEALTVFGLITMVLVGFEIFYTYAARGFAYGFSSNRPDLPWSGFGLRMKRTLQNHVESAAYIVPVLLATALAEPKGDYVSLACALIVIGRAAFIPLYYSGIVFLRVPAFSVASLSTLYLAIILVMDMFSAGAA